MKSFKLLALPLLLVSSVVLAMPMTSTIILPGGGTVAPGASVTVPYNSLSSSVTYTISCNIANNNSQAVDMGFVNNVEGQGSMQMSATLNGTGIQNYAGNYQAAVPAAAKNSFQAINMTVNSNDNQSLVFSNLDKSNSVTVSGCVATPVT